MESKEEKSRPSLSVVIMGVSGCGKSTLGAKISSILGTFFEDGDHFHPDSNVEKMKSGASFFCGPFKNYYEVRPKNRFNYLKG